MRSGTIRKRVPHCTTHWSSESRAGFQYSARVLTFEHPRHGLD